MKLNQQIKYYRNALNISQEELAEKIFVTRQTVSNWETGKNYPDIHSLLLMSSLFSVSLDELVKGDIEVMKETIRTESIKEYSRYAGIYSILFIGLILSAAPLLYYLEMYGIAIWTIYAAVTFIVALKVEKLKKKNHTHTYKEIVAFMNGERLDEIRQSQEDAKRPYQQFLLAMSAGCITLLVIIVMMTLLKALS